MLKHSQAPSTTDPLAQLVPLSVSFNVMCAHNGAWAVRGSNSPSSCSQALADAAVLTCVLQDVWDLCWATDNPELLAIMEKGRMVVLRGTESEEPVTSSAWLAGFSDLQVRSRCSTWGVHHVVSCWAQRTPCNPVTRGAACLIGHVYHKQQSTLHMHVDRVVVKTHCCACVLSRRFMLCCWTTSCSSRRCLSSA
jgi:hypothetical protein